ETTQARVTSPPACPGRKLFVNAPIRYARIARYVVVAITAASRNRRQRRPASRNERNRVATAPTNHPQLPSASLSRAAPKSIVNATAASSPALTRPRTQKEPASARSRSTASQVREGG